VVGGEYERAQSLLDAAGLNLRGVASIARYDACVPAAWRAEHCLPAARSAVVVAAGGRRLFSAFRTARATGARVGNGELDAHVRAVVARAAECIAGRDLYAWERRGGAFADFVALGRTVGLGAPSRLGLLLHPQYGPWMSIRAVVLTPLVLSPDAPQAGFDPCHGCAAPCADVCPGGALAGARFDVAACGATRRREPACALACAARRACVLGRNDQYTAAAEAHHMRAAALDNFP
jgi:epoxyqueuosine reductase QueG